MVARARRIPRPPRLDPALRRSGVPRLPDLRLTVRDNGAVDSTFPRARKPQLGYNTAQVEEFLQVARRAYDGTAWSPYSASVTVTTLR